MMRALRILAMLMLTGCTRGLTPPQIAAGEAACETRGGIRYLWADVITLDRFHVTCADSTEVSGKVKP